MTDTHVVSALKERRIKLATDIEAEGQAFNLQDVNGGKAQRPDGSHSAKRLVAAKVTKSATEAINNLTRYRYFVLSSDNVIGEDSCEVMAEVLDGVGCPSKKNAPETIRGVLSFWTNQFDLALGNSETLGEDGVATASR